MLMRFLMILLQTMLVHEGPQMVVLSVRFSYFHRGGPFMLFWWLFMVLFQTMLMTRTDGTVPLHMMLWNCRGGAFMLLRWLLMMLFQTMLMARADAMLLPKGDPWDGRALGTPTHLKTNLVISIFDNIIFF